MLSRHHSVTKRFGFLPGSPRDSAGLPIGGGCRGELTSQPGALLTEHIYGRGGRVCRSAPHTPRCVQDPCRKKTAFRAPGDRGEGRKGPASRTSITANGTVRTPAEQGFNGDATPHGGPSWPADAGSSLPRPGALQESSEDSSHQSSRPRR